MKKIFLLFFILLLSLGACDKTTLLSETAPTVETTAIVEWSTYMPEDIMLEAVGYVSLDDFGTIANYRRVYYFVDYDYGDLIDNKKEIEILTKLDERNYDDSGKYIEPAEMNLVSIIKYCRISKDVFIEASEKRKRQILEFVESDGRNIKDIEFDSEQVELPNVDIIYTFDNEVINAYYRRENPVAPDWSQVKTYESYAEYQKAKG